MSDNNNKKVYPFRFKKEFKEQMDAVAKHEGISTTYLIEREVGRYLRLLKKVGLEKQRKDEIERRLREEKKKGG